MKLLKNPSSFLSTKTKVVNKVDVQTTEDSNKIQPSYNVEVKNQVVDLTASNRIPTYRQEASNNAKAKTNQFLSSLSLASKP